MTITAYPLRDVLMRPARKGGPRLSARPIVRSVSDADSIHPSLSVSRSPFSSEPKRCRDLVGMPKRVVCRMDTLSCWKTRELIEAF